jgi:hypothetical protein
MKYLIFLFLSFFSWLDVEGIEKEKKKKKKGKSEILKTKEAKKG